MNLKQAYRLRCIRELLKWEKELANKVCFLHAPNYQKHCKDAFRFSQVLHLLGRRLSKSDRGLTTKQLRQKYGVK